MKARLFVLVTLTALGIAGTATAMPRHHAHPNPHAYEASVAATPAPVVDHHFGALSTGDTRTTATGGPSGGIN